MPYHAILYHVPPYCAILCHVPPWHAILCHVPYHAILCHVPSYHVILCHVPPYCAILCHVPPYHAILYNFTIPYYTMPCSTILCYTMPCSTIPFYTILCSTILCYTKPCSTMTCYTMPCTIPCVDFVVKELNHLDSRKATGLDNINARILQNVSHVLAAPFTDIINSFLKYGEVPHDWKKSRDTQIFKAGDSQIASNYTPILIIIVVMKVFEWAVNTQVSEFVRD